MMKSIAVYVFAFLIAGVSVASAGGDIKKGKKVFKKCKACHSVGENAKNKVGPMLNGVVGRAWGEVEGYKYSKSLLSLAEGKVWDIENLSAYLRKPKAVIPKGKMAFAGLKKDKDIDNILLYLAQYADDGTKVDPEERLKALQGDGG